MTEKKKIAIAMSGGIDSSAAAALLVDQGYEVVGLTARMWKEGSRCCSLEDVERARRIAWFLGIRHVVINAYDVFSRCVVDRFAAEYARGRTPSPCVVCNQIVKFGLLMTRTVQFGCAGLATGHYARIEEQDGAYHLLKARDVSRDQSYFLHRLSQRQLAHTVFPLGDLSKRNDVLPYVQKRGLPLEGRTESQDICFAPKGRHHEIVERIFPDVREEGDMVDAHGTKRGRHQGVHRYTIGQRRGLGLAEGQPMYVVRIDGVRNQVVVGTRADIASSSCSVEDCRWIAGLPPDNDCRLDVRIRYQHAGAPAKISGMSDGRFRVDFETPQDAVTPGQAAVFYSGDEVLGGGWISGA